MSVRTFLRASLVAALPAAVAAQSPGLRPGSVLVTAGVGSGAGSFSCGACESRRDLAFAGLVRVDVALTARTAMGVEGSGWTSDYADPRGTGTARMVFANLVATWHPKRGAGAFVKAGGGVASLRDEVTIDRVGQTTITARGPSFTVGAGWDVALAPHVSIAPYADLAVATKREQIVNGSASYGKLGGSVIQAGVALTFR
jgi:hypothetical protein